jgi:hypothetical protein
MTICRHCKEPFERKPGKNRRIDECPRCKPEPEELPTSAMQSHVPPAEKRWDYEAPGMKKLIVDRVRSHPKFAKLSRKEAFDLWRVANLKGIPWATKVLSWAREIQKIDIDF